MLEILPCLGLMGLVYKAPESIWFFSLCCVNPLTPKISLVILLTVCCMVLAMLVSRIWYFLFSHHLSASYCIDIVRRISWSLMGVKGLKLLRSCTSGRHTPFTLSLYRWINAFAFAVGLKHLMGRRGCLKIEWELPRSFLSLIVVPTWMVSALTHVCLTPVWLCLC